MERGGRRWLLESVLFGTEHAGSQSGRRGDGGGGLKEKSRPERFGNAEKGGGES